MRIAGIYPQPLDLDLVLDPDPDEPLGLGYVLAAAEEIGHDSRLFVPIDGDWEAMWVSLLAFDPDVVGVSVMTKHVPAARLLARRLREEIDPRLIVAGGPHPTAAPADLLDDFDVCVIGEGERTFQSLLRALECPDGVPHFPGLAYRDAQGEVQHTGLAQRIDALDSLPYPLRHTAYRTAPAYGICNPSGPGLRFASALFSRGCPYACDFCSSPAHWRRKMLYRDPQCVIEELRHVRDNAGVNFVAFADLTFTQDKRATSDLCRAMIDSRLRIDWACETSVSRVDEALLALMRAAGCTKTCWGIESVNAANLARIGKRQTPRQSVDALGWSQDNGMFNWAFYIIGYPWQTDRDILSECEVLIDYPIHQLRVSIATPFPGTPWAEHFPYVRERNLALYDSNQLVYEHPTISPARMKDLQAAVLHRFYSSSAYHSRMATLGLQFPDLRPSIDEFMAHVTRFLADGMTILYRPGAQFDDLALAHHSSTA